MTTKMDVDPKEMEETRIAIHPLTIVHMSDQYTRISCGGSPLDKNAPVEGLLFGSKDDDSVLQIRDADEIPTEVSDASTLQVDLHRAVFPQHSVVGWYRVSATDEEPTSTDLQTTQQLQRHYADSARFYFCLLRVEQEGKKQLDSTEESKSDAVSSLQQELPVNIYVVHTVGDNQQQVLLGLSDWQLETSEPERIAVERVMKERPEGSHTNMFVTQTQSVQQSLLSMRVRIQLMVQFLERTGQGSIPPNYSLLRQVQGLLYSLGPLSVRATSQSSAGKHEDAELLSHLAAVSKTVSAVQTYTDRFRLVHESKSASKEMRPGF